MLQSISPLASLSCEYFLFCISSVLFSSFFFSVRYQKRTHVTPYPGHVALSAHTCVGMGARDQKYGCSSVRLELEPLRGEISLL